MSKDMRDKLKQLKQLSNVERDLYTRLPENRCTIRLSQVINHTVFFLATFYYGCAYIQPGGTSKFLREIR
jgi:hypothetical protein